MLAHALRQWVPMHVDWTWAAVNWHVFNRLPDPANMLARLGIQGVIYWQQVNHHVQ
jgi:hypothetical protein